MQTEGVVDYLTSIQNNIMQYHKSSAFSCRCCFYEFVINRVSYKHQHATNFRRNASNIKPIVNSIFVLRWKSMHSRRKNTMHANSECLSITSLKPAYKNYRFVTWHPVPFVPFPSADLGQTFPSKILR